MSAKHLLHEVAQLLRSMVTRGTPKCSYPRRLPPEPSQACDGGTLRILALTGDKTEIRCAGIFPSLGKNVLTMSQTWFPTRGSKVSCHTEEGHVQPPPLGGAHQQAHVSRRIWESPEGRPPSQACTVGGFYFQTESSPEYTGIMT